MRHFLGRRSDAKSQSSFQISGMVLATLKIWWYINENNGFAEYQSIFLSADASFSQKKIRMAVA
jgi:hypothetical protein